MQIKKDDIDKRILSVSEDLFIRNGYDRTSMKMIAEKCYISKSNIYRYYDSKEAIYETLVRDARNALLAEAKHMVDPGFIRKDLNTKIEEASASLADIASRYRTGILIMLRNTGGRDRIMIEGEYTRLFVERAAVDDEDIKTLIAKLLIIGLTDIIMNHDGEEDLRKSVIMLFKYHYKGLTGFGEGGQ